MTQTLESPPSPTKWTNPGPGVAALLFQQRTALEIQYRELVSAGDAQKQAELLNVMMQLAVIRQATERELPQLSRDAGDYSRERRMASIVADVKAEIVKYAEAHREATAKVKAFIAAGLSDWTGNVLQWEAHRDKLFQQQHDALTALDDARSRLGPLEKELSEFRGTARIFKPIE